MNFIDKTIAYFAPGFGLQRQQYRKALSLARKYEGASHSRRTGGWHTSGASANSELQVSVDVLRNRARDLVRNNPYAARAVSVISANTVGTGIIPSIKSPTTLLQDRHEALWRAWAETTDCDFECKLTFYAMQQLVMKAVVESGEVLVRRRIVKGARNPVKLQVLEADHLVTNRLFTYEATGNRVITGIEVDASGCPVAYHLYENHPGSNGMELTRATNSFNVVRIPADEIIHVFREDRPGQLRGPSWFASVMLRMRDLDEFEDAMLVRQKVAACYAAFVTDIEPPLDNGTPDQPAIERLEPGIIEYLPPGKDIKFGTPPLPSSDSYPAYISTMLRAISTGLGISYEAMTNDYSQVNFSSGRMGWLEFQRNIDTWRRHMIGPKLNSRVFDWFRQGAELTGEDMSNVSVSWTSPKREMIDPTKEVSAKIAAIRGGLESLSDVIRQNGKDPFDQLDEMRKDNQLLDQLGLVLDTDPRHTAQTGQLQLQTQPAPN